MSCICGREHHKIKKHHKNRIKEVRRSGQQRSIQEVSCETGAGRDNHVDRVLIGDRVRRGVCACVHVLDERDQRALDLCGGGDSGDSGVYSVVLLQEIPS